MRASNKSKKKTEEAVSPPAKQIFFEVRVDDHVRCQVGNRFPLTIEVWNDRVAINLHEASYTVERGLLVVRGGRRPDEFTATPTSSLESVVAIRTRSLRSFVGVLVEEMARLSARAGTRGETVVDLLDRLKPLVLKSEELGGIVSGLSHKHQELLHQIEELERLKDKLNAQISVERDALEEELSRLHEEDEKEGEGGA